MSQRLNHRISKIETKQPGAGAEHTLIIERWVIEPGVEEKTLHSSQTVNLGPCARIGPLRAP